MTADDPNQNRDAQDDATNQGVSAETPAEGSDDAPAGGGGSPERAEPE